MTLEEANSTQVWSFELKAAREHVRTGRTADAERSYLSVLKMLPDSIEALVYLGNAAQARGDGCDAVNLLSRASKAEPANVEILMNLGAVYRSAERFDAARYVLERAVRLSAGRNAYARLSLARVLELDQRSDLAMLHYCRALIETQRLHTSTSDDQLRDWVAHAKEYVATARRAWLERVLRECGHAAAPERGTRINAALALYLEARPPEISDPQQRAGLMYVPGVQTGRFIDNARFDWLDRVPEEIARCVGEMELCVSSSISSGKTMVDAAAIRIHVLSAGVLQYLPRLHSPMLLSTLRRLPLADVPHHAPDVDIVALECGARFSCHYGRSNSRCCVVVNPIRSGTFQVTVGGESRILQPVSAFVIDPSFGVEYLNAGEASAVALVFEVWHPEISYSEQQALGALITAVVDFDIRLQELD